MSKLLVDFQPVGRRIEVEPGTDLLAAAQTAGVQLASICGGVGVCEDCRVRLASGRLTPLTLEEQAGLSAADLSSGMRLACQSSPLTDVRIDIPPESLTAPQRLQVEGQEVEIELDPPVRALDLALPPASLEDLRADDRRLKDGLAEAGEPAAVVSTAVMSSLAVGLRQQGWQARLALRGQEVVAALPLGTPLLGLSVDVGTTKIAAYLVDLESGRTLAKTGAMNPQVSYGEDVVSRIAYANETPGGAAELQSRLVETLNGLVDALCRQADRERLAIVEAVVVGNTAMHHLFLGLPARSLGEAPYVAVVAAPVDVHAAQLGLKLAAGAYVHVPPNVAGYVGADHVAMLLATGVWETRRTVLALDIGTNTEITLAAGGRLLSCSTASGPVFEGAHIREGMRAAPGAIERVQYLDGRLRLQTIDELPPVGICGSGILDAVAEMLKAGAVDGSGRLLKDHPLVEVWDGRPGIALAQADESGHGRPVVVDRKDVHEIQLAKGAIRAGSEILLAEAGLSAADVEEVIIAGAFGTYIHVPSAVAVGMFPALPLERFKQVGNAAGVGAKQMLLSQARRRLAQEIARRVEYIELTTYADFTPQYIQAMYFPDSTAG